MGCPPFAAICLLRAARTAGASQTGQVIRDLDLTLAGWLGTVLDGTPVTFDVPPDDPAPAPAAGRAEARGAAATTVALELYDVRLDADASTAGWASVRDERGVEVGRVPPAKTYRLTYLLTAHGPDALTEHDVLGRVLTAAAAHEVVPAEHVVGSLAESARQVLLRCAPARPLTDAHERRGREGRRVALELSLLASLPQGGLSDLAAPPSHVELGTRTPSPRPAVDRQALVPRPTARITEGH